MKNLPFHYALMLWTSDVLEKLQALLITVISGEGRKRGGAFK